MQVFEGIDDLSIWLGDHYREITPIVFHFPDRPDHLQRFSSHERTSSMKTPELLL